MLRRPSLQALIVHSGISEGGAISISASFADEMTLIGTVQQCVAVDPPDEADSDASNWQSIDLRPVIIDFLDRYLK